PATRIARSTRETGARGRTRSLILEPLPAPTGAASTLPSAEGGGSGPTRELGRPESRSGEPRERQERTMKTYEVRMSDRIENTGLDCQYFATREEAQKAADMVNEQYPEARAEVCESDQPVTLT